MISDPTVKRIGYTHDDTGRVTKITSYSDAAGTTVRNEIARTYSGASWDRVTAVQFRGHITNYGDREKRGKLEE